jgi:predicted ATPase
VLSARGGDPDTAVELLRVSLNGMREGRYYILYTMFLCDLAEALSAAGRCDESVTAVDEALEQVTRKEELWFLPEVLRIKGELDLLKGVPRSAVVAEDHFLQSLALARRQGALSWELRSVMSLARLRQSQDRGEDARELLAPVYDRFTEGFDTADLKAAKALIEEIR